MKTLLERFVRFVMIVIVILSVAHLAMAQTPPVPAEYQSLYNGLSSELSQAAQLIQGQVPPANAAPVMMTELQFANSENGSRLLDPLAKTNCTLELQRYYEMGLRGVQVSIAWPMLTSVFPSYQQYQSFYAWVAQEAHSLGMRITVKFSSFFPSSDFYTNISWTYPSNLTVQQLGQGLNQQAQWVLANMRPEYLTLLNEPDTQGKSMGITLDPTSYQTMIQIASTGLSRGSTVVAAGAGSWSCMQYFQNLAALSTLDAIDVHVYPIINNYMSNALQQIAGICSQNNKRLNVGESWCEPVDQTAWAARASGEEQALALRAYSFWEPLDEQFNAIMWQQAKLYNMQFISFFSGWYFWGNVTWSSSTSMETLGAAALYNLGNQAGVAGLQANTLVELGQDVEELLATAPKITSPTPGSTLTSSSVTFTWSPDSAASQYQLSVGTTPGGTNLYNQNEGTALSATVSGLPTNGSTVYVRLWYLVGGVWSFVDVTFTAANIGVIPPAITSPKPGSALTSPSTTFTWSAGSGVTQYWLSVGTTSGGTNLYNQNEGTNLSATVGGLPTNGSTLYVRLWYLAGGIWLYGDVTYTAPSGAVVAPTMVSPTPGTRLTSSSATFTWTAGSGVTQYWLSVGTVQGGTDLYNQNAGTNLSATASSLPTNGSTLYVRLWYLAGIWLYEDYTYSAANGGGTPSITSPANGSTLTSSTVTFTWSAGASQYWLYVGTTLGGFNIYNLNEGTSLSATVSGLPTNGSTLYVRLWYLQGGVWLYTDYTYVAR